VALDLVGDQLWINGGTMMSMASVFARLGATVLVLAAVSAVAYRHGAEQGRLEVQAEWDAQRAAQARTTIRLMEARDAAEQRLAEITERQRKDYRRAIQALTAERDALLVGLQHRAERGSDAGGANLSGDPGADPGGTRGCTGRDLYREDAAFLVGESYRADRLQLALNQCKAQYNAVREKVNGLSRQ